MSHGKNYDAKNMMYTFRLLRMAKEIAMEQTINVKRSDRNFLLEIKQGKYGYEELVDWAETLKQELEVLFAGSALPEKPNMEQINNLLVNLRTDYHKSY